MKKRPQKRSFLSSPQGVSLARSERANFESAFRASYASTIIITHAFCIVNRVARKISKNFCDFTFYKKTIILSGFVL